MAAHISLLLSGAERGHSDAFEQMCVACSGEPVADLNLAALWGTASDLDVDLLLDHLGELDAMVVVSEEAKDRLGPKLQEEGLTPGGSCPLMTADLEGAIAEGSGYRVEAARGQEDLGAMTEALADAYSIPAEHVHAAFGPALLAEQGVTPFVAWMHGVARSALVATSVGANVGIWEVGTPVRFQRQGAGRALLTAVMSRAAADGAERCFLFPSPAGRRLYESLGFADADGSEIWLKGSSTEFPS